MSDEAVVVWAVRVDGETFEPVVEWSANNPNGVCWLVKLDGSRHVWAPGGWVEVEASPMLLGQTP